LPFKIPEFEIAGKKIDLNNENTREEIYNVTKKIGNVLQDQRVKDFIKWF